MSCFLLGRHRLHVQSLSLPTLQHNAWVNDNKYKDNDSTSFRLLDYAYYNQKENW
jgi:hypothetical protein